MSLFAELKRRNVFRVAAAYLALGWIVTQVTSTVAPMLHLPDWIGPVVLWIGVIGFPFAVMFAWVYELTPEGLKKESEVEAASSITHETARRLDYVIIALLVVAMGLYAFQQFRPSANPRVGIVAATQRGATGAATLLDRSVAVLPFVNMSDDKGNEYFADGLSEELLNLLAQVPQLRVIARTSSFSFKDKEVDIAEIAHRLNVANVLEGSVRKSGDKIRITAQLVRASDSSHLWSRTYDRQVTDVFAVQDEIAAAVVEQLKVTLLGAAPRARETDPQAYALYLQGRELARQYSTTGLEQAIDLLQQALAIDPAYAPAWYTLAVTYWSQVDLGVVPYDRGLELGSAAARKAIAADPSYGSAYAILAVFEGFIERDYPAAAKHLEQGAVVDPANIEVLSMTASLLRRLNRFGPAIELGEYVVARDPVNIQGYDSLALAYRYSGQMDKAVDAYRKVLSMAPDSGWRHTALGNVYLEMGDAKSALAEFQKEPVECFRLGGLSMAYHSLGRQVESDAALAEVTRECADSKPFNLATVLAYRGDFDGAFAMLDRAARLQDSDLGAVAAYPTFAVLHADPRWPALLRRLGLAPEQLAVVRLDVKVPG